MIVLNKQAKQTDNYKYKIFEVKWGRNFYKYVKGGG